MSNLQALLEEVDSILVLEDKVAPSPVGETSRSRLPVGETPGLDSPVGETSRSRQVGETPQSQQPDALLTALNTHFGYTKFRAGQREIIDAILGGENVFAIFPTGHGKSLCYQLPALMLPGITVVITPLISLMKNQVDALKAQGIADIALINSTQTFDEYRSELARIQQGEVKLLYISPERLRSRRFLALLNTCTISLFVIDEAHCISQWGRDFRPAYLALRDTLDALQPHGIALFTATAPPEIREDVLNLLHIPTPKVMTQGIERPNLKLSVQESGNKDEKYQQLAAFLYENAADDNGIIYAGTRKNTEDIANRLKARGFRAEHYHAGLEPHQRTRVQEAFFDNSENGLNIVVATNAFGMGIDKPDIRYIVHWTMTGTLEEYCQEIGRAGRDGEDSQCVLLYCPEDRKLHEWFIKENAPDKPSLLKLLKVIENFEGAGPYRTIANDELEWMSGFKSGKILGCLSYLEKLGFLKRWYHVPSQVSVRFGHSMQNSPILADTAQQRLLSHLQQGRQQKILDLSKATGLNPNAVMEHLAELLSDGYIQYRGQEDLMLIELILDSELFNPLTEEQIEVGDYVRRKRQQIDKVVFYALEATCRTRVIREYFDEDIEKDYRCKTCDLCATHNGKLRA